MHYTATFKEKAIQEMCLRAGYPNVSAYASKIGAKEFARKREKFYEEFYTEENEKYKISNSSEAVIKYKDLPEKLELIFQYLTQNPDSRIYKVEDLFSFSRSYLNIISKLGYIKNSGTKYNPFFIVNRNNKSTSEIIAEVRNYAKLNQRRNRLNEAKRIDNGK
ncbi:hypothetical protein [Chishuiella changwenlii]|uniref:hypothetical protein n=1 Tax=Chishuiella changwenlii TaxID=1434701 RepID=UPI002FDA23FC